MLTCYLFVLSELWDSLHFLALFWQTRSFVFITLQTLLQKKPAGGYIDCQNPANSVSRERIGKLIVGINPWIRELRMAMLLPTHGTNIDAPYHLC
jgi:hypothetical protein